MRTRTVPWHDVGPILAVLIGCLIVGLFLWGWAVFTGRIRMPASRRQSPTFERIFPKVFGAFLIFCAGYVLVLATLGMLGVFGKR